MIIILLTLILKNYVHGALCRFFKWNEWCNWQRSIENILKTTHFPSIFIQTFNHLLIWRMSTSRLKVENKLWVNTKECKRLFFSCFFGTAIQKTVAWNDKVFVTATYLFFSLLKQKFCTAVSLKKRSFFFLKNDLFCKETNLFSFVQHKNVNTYICYELISDPWLTIGLKENTWLTTMLYNPKAKSFHINISILLHKKTFSLFHIRNVHDILYDKYIKLQKLCVNN